MHRNVPPTIIKHIETELNTWSTPNDYYYNKNYNGSIMTNRYIVDIEMYVDCNDPDQKGAFEKLRHGGIDEFINHYAFNKNKFDKVIDDGFGKLIFNMKDDDPEIRSIADRLAKFCADMNRSTSNGTTK